MLVQPAADPSPLPDILAQRRTEGFQRTSRSSIWSGIPHPSPASLSNAAGSIASSPSFPPQPGPRCVPGWQDGQYLGIGGGQGAGGGQKQLEVIFKNKSRECPWLEDFCFLRRRADRWPFKAETWEQPRLNWKTAGEAAGMANSFSPLRGMFLKP